jgi:hypothetical protein
VLQSTKKSKQVKVFATNTIFGKNRRSPVSEKPSRKPALFITKKLRKKRGIMMK